MTRHFGALFVTLLLLAPLMAWSADSGDRIGVVHASQILAQNKQFQTYSRQYAADQARLHHLKGSSRVAMQASMKKWDSIRSHFVSSSMKKMQAAAQTVAKDKRLSFVLLDAPWNGGPPLAQEGAVDVTTDVMLAMRSH